MKIKTWLTGAFAVSAVAMSCSLFTSPSSSSSSNSSSSTSKTVLAAYGVKTDLGSPTDSSGNTLSSSYNPLGYKTATILARKELFISGLTTSDGKRASILDESSTNAYGTLGTDTDDSWAKNPHASAAGDIDGSGVEKAVSVVFFQNNGATYQNSQDNKGTVKLEIVSGTGSTYTRTEVPLSGTFDLTGGGGGDNDNIRYFFMHIALGDIDGDGRDEIAVVIGNTLEILDDANANYAVLKTVTFDHSSHSTSSFHPTTVAAGDINGDGNDEFIVTDGDDQGSAKAQYHVYGGAAGNEIGNGGTIQTSTYGLQYASVAVGDIDGDKTPEVVFVGHTASKATKYYVLAAKWSSTNSNLSFFSSTYSDDYSN